MLNRQTAGKASASSEQRAVSRPQGRRCSRQSATCIPTTRAVHLHSASGRSSHKLCLLPRCSSVAWRQHAEGAQSAQGLLSLQSSFSSSESSAVCKCWSAENSHRRQAAGAVLLCRQDFVGWCRCTINAECFMNMDAITVAKLVIGKKKLVIIITLPGNNSITFPNCWAS